MRNIASVSELEGYDNVLTQCEGGMPLYLMKDGQERYVVQTIENYERQVAGLHLLAELTKGVRSIQSEGGLTIEEAFEGLVL